MVVAKSVLATRAASLAIVWPNLRAAGAQVLVLVTSGIVDATHEIDRYRAAAVPDLDG